MSSSLVDRMKLMLSTGDGADVHFLVGKEKELLPAHKQILKHASVVFEEMLRFFDSQNGKAEKASADITVTEVPDVEAAAFKVILNFIYTEDLSELNGQNAMAVLYAANKYNIALLLKAFLDFPINELPNIFLAYGLACFLNQNDFANRCLSYICQNAGSLFGSEEFLQIDQNILDEMFERNQLTINNEFELWEAALRWADEKCRQNAIECSAANRRSALGPALFKIRFPLIPQREFSTDIVPSGVLTVEEFVGIYQFHSHPNLSGVPGLYPLKFPSHARISDWNIPKRNRGTLVMEIEKLSEFVQQKEGSSRFSDVVPIKGLPLKIWAQIRSKEDSTEKWLGFFLKCDASKEDENRSCICSSTYRIVSQMRGTEDLIGKRNDHFCSIKKGRGFHGFITFEQLMKTSRGLYDKNEDKVTLAIDFTVENKNSLKFDSGPNKSNGKIVMEIGKLSDFTREICGSQRSSEPLKINGQPWQILTLITVKKDSTEKSLGFFLRCNAPREDENWNCLCTATFRIVSQNSETEDLMGKRNYHILKNKMNTLGFSNFITFSELMDPSKGLYDREEDKVKLAIDFRVLEKTVEKLFSHPNKSIGKIVMEIGKMSEFAREIFESERSSEGAQIQGFVWGVSAILNTAEGTAEKCLVFYLLCGAQTKDEIWSCNSTSILRIVSKKGEAELIYFSDNSSHLERRLKGNGEPAKGISRISRESITGRPIDLRLGGTPRVPSSSLPFQALRGLITDA
ncbi:hypothetical protein niasHT_010397 [Heterodera trifolii]|uniref:BTB domain-containing protein n=1 Tax=Heterodera trifolii TaxID=157864 RepID=A0ABD2MCT3_9BILA